LFSELMSNAKYDRALQPDGGMPFGSAGIFDAAHPPSHTRRMREVAGSGQHARVWTGEVSLR